MASRPQALPGTGGVRIPDWQGAQRAARTERKLGERFPLPAPKMAARASPPCETHALCPTSASQVLLDFCKSPWEPSRGGPRTPAAIPPPIPSPKPLYPRQRMHWKRSAYYNFTPCPACNTSCSRRATGARLRGPERRAIGPSPHFIGGPMPWGGPTCPLGRGPCQSWEIGKGRRRRTQPLGSLCCQSKRHPATANVSPR